MCDIVLNAIKKSVLLDLQGIVSTHKATCCGLQTANSPRYGSARNYKKIG